MLARGGYQSAKYHFGYYHCEQTSQYNYIGVWVPMLTLCSSNFLTMSDSADNECRDVGTNIQPFYF